ncbi:hypothetical protein N2152v2_000894 [Parachlorella kessleri]
MDSQTGAGATSGRTPDFDHMSVHELKSWLTNHGVDLTGEDQPYHQQQQQPPSITKQPASAAAAGVTWRSLLASAVGKLLTNLWPLLLVHLVSDGLTFGLHRVSHRLTNEAAVRLLAGIGITPAAIGNMWWLSSDPALANFRTGYQFLTIAVFLLAFPLNVLLKATASIYTVFICEGDVGKEVQRPWWQAPGALRAALPLVRGLSGRVGAVWRRALLVELLVAIIVVPLQFTSLAVVTLPFTLPFLLDLQAAGTAAVLEGVGGIAAIKRSRQLIKPIRWKLAVPFVGIVVAQHVMNSAKGFLLGNLPPRYYLELVEIPAAIAVLGTLATLLLTRLQDVLPYTAYTAAAALEGAQGPGGGGTRELPAAEQQPQPKPV